MNNLIYDDFHHSILLIDDYNNLTLLSLLVGEIQGHKKDLFNNRVKNLWNVIYQKMKTGKFKNFTN